MIARILKIRVLWNVVWLLALRVQSSPLVLVYRIEEDCQLGTLLADIKTDSRLSERYSSAVVDQLRFVMLTTQTGVNPRHHFHVDEVTGLVRAASSLDRDDICPASHSCKLNVDFAVQPPDYFQLIKVCITSAILLPISLKSHKLFHCKLIIQVSLMIIM